MTKSRIVKLYNSRSSLGRIVQILSNGLIRLLNERESEEEEIVGSTKSKSLSKRLAIQGGKSGHHG